MPNTRITLLGAVVSALALATQVAPVCAQMPTRSEIVAYDELVWDSAGRASVAANLGLRAGPSRGQWAQIRAWIHSDNVATFAYSAQPVVDAALSLAAASGDDSLLDDVAAFYVAVLPRFVTVGQRKAMGNHRIPGLIDAGPDSARTLTWVDPHGQPSECLLCDAQFLFPAARLARMLAQRPASAVSPAGAAFLRAYVPFLAYDHVLRLAYQVSWDVGHGHVLGRALVGEWSALLRGERPVAPKYDYSLRDRDLWILGAAAELVRASAEAPGTVELGAGAIDSLRRFVQLGAARLRQSADPMPGTLDRAGRVVGSLSFFDGDFDGHPDVAYAADTSASIPALDAQRPAVGVSWDVSHLSRLPITLASLYGARRATDAAFPDSASLAGAVRQLAFRVYNGDTLRPRLRNYFDGTDGWYRVGYEGRTGFGHPPSAYCNGDDPRRGCIGASGILGWGRLVWADSSLDPLDRSLLRLAGSNDSAEAEYRDRYFRLYHQSFAFRALTGGRNFSLLLFEFTTDLLDGSTCHESFASGRRASSLGNSADAGAYTCS